VIDANRARIAELKTRAYASPDLHDLIWDIMKRSNPPALSLAAAAWILQAVGLVPTPMFGAAAVAVGAVGAVSRRVGHRLHAEQIPPAASQAAEQLWQRHPGLVMSLLSIALGMIIDSIQNAMSVDDSELEDELDAFYPRWSRVDFEVDPRRFRK
jgi:hypothetical protein